MPTTPDEPLRDGQHWTLDHSGLPTHTGIPRAERNANRDRLRRMFDEWERTDVQAYRRYRALSTTRDRAAIEAVLASMPDELRAVHTITRGMFL